MEHRPALARREERDARLCARRERVSPSRRLALRVLLPVAGAVAALILGMGSAAAKESEHSGDHDGSDHYIRSTVAAVHQKASDRHGDAHGDGEHRGDDSHGVVKTPAAPTPHLGNQQQYGDHQGAFPVQTVATTGTRSPSIAQVPPPVPLPTAPAVLTPPGGAGTNPAPQPPTGNPGGPPRTAPVAPHLTVHPAPSAGGVIAPAPASTPPAQPDQPKPAPGRQFPNTVLIPPLALPAPAVANAVTGGTISPLPLVVLFLAMGLLLAVLGMRLGRRRTH